VSARAWKRPPERVDANAHVGRVPPHDLDVEAAVLSACLLEGRIDDVAHKIPRAELFFSVAHRRIWEALVALSTAGAKIDAVTVAGWLKSREVVLDQIGNVPFLGKICDAAPVTAHAEAYAAKLGELWQRRLAIATFQKLAAGAYGDVGDHREWLSTCEAQVIAVGEALTREGDGMQPIATILRDVIADQMATKKAGLMTGLRDFDDMTTGLHAGELTIIGARPGMGKTSLMLDVAMAVADQGRGVALFSLEMPKEQIAGRMVCSNASVNLKNWRGRTLSTGDWERIHQSTEWLATLGIHVDDTADLALVDIMIKVRRVAAECEREGRPLGLVALDYLQLAKGAPEAGNREQEIAGLARGLKRLSKTIRVPVVALSQLNRGVETRAKDQRPKLSDLRESGAIEQDADTIVFLYRDDYYTPNSPLQGIAEIITAKQRNGPTGTVAAAWRAHCARFEDASDEQKRVWDLTQENDGKKGGGR
jgi:replicative DNA helicase